MEPEILQCLEAGQRRVVELVTTEGECRRKGMGWAKATRKRCCELNLNLTEGGFS